MVHDPTDAVGDPELMPTVIWAALIGVGGVLLGSLLTLGGVLMQARHQRQLQRQTLEHDAKQRDREREMSMRRDLFIPAADAVSRLQNVLGSLCDLNAPDETIHRTFSEATAALSRVQVVANNATVQAVSAYLLEHGAAYTDLLFERGPLAQRRDYIGVLNQSIERAVADQTRWVQAMQQANVVGNASPQLWSVLNGNFNVASEQIKKLSAQRDALTVEFQRLQVQLLKRGLEKLQALMLLINPMLFAVRDELELPIDKLEYQRTAEEAARRTRALSESLVSRLTQHVEQTALAAAQRPGGG